jgi:hypothetical protein
MSWAEALQRSAPGNEGLFVINVRHTMMTRALVDILRHLLNEREETGVVFSVDRPSTYLSQLLEHQGIVQDRLMFLDAVTRISGEDVPPTDKLELITSPFCVNLLTEFVSCHSSKVAASRRGFVVVDNLGALKPYLTNPCVERLVQTLKNLGGGVPGFRCIFVMDKEAHPELHDVVMRNGAKEVSVC